MALLNVLQIRGEKMGWMENEAILNVLIIYAHKNNSCAAQHLHWRRYGYTRHCRVYIRNTESRLIYQVYKVYMWPGLKPLHADAYKPAYCVLMPYKRTITSYLEAIQAYQHILFLWLYFIYIGF